MQRAEAAETAVGGRRRKSAGVASAGKGCSGCSACRAPSLAGSADCVAFVCVWRACWCCAAATSGTVIRTRGTLLTRVAPPRRSRAATAREMRRHSRRSSRPYSCSSSSCRGSPSARRPSPARSAARRSADRMMTARRTLRALTPLTRSVAKHSGRWTRLRMGELEI